MQTTRYLIGYPSVVTLYSESNHPQENPRQVFQEAVDKFNAMSKKQRTQGSPLHSLNTTLTRFLLKERYRTDGGSHQAGDRMFIIPDEPMTAEHEFQAMPQKGTIESHLITLSCDTESTKEQLASLVSDIVGIPLDGSNEIDADNYTGDQLQYVSKAPFRVDVTRQDN